MGKSRHVTSVTSERPPFPAPRPDSNPYDPVPTDYDDVDQHDVTGYATINDVGQLRKKKEKDDCDVTLGSLPDCLDEEEEDRCYNFNKAASRRAAPEMQYLTPRPSEPDLATSAGSLLNPGGRKMSRDVMRLKNSTDSIIRYDSPRPSLDGSNVYLHQPVYKPDTFSVNHDYDHVCTHDEGYDVPNSFKPV